jgi:glycosyl transferase family 25
MTLNDFVDKIYCINLDRRPDRWARCQEIFKQHDLKVERAPAIDGKTLLGGSLPLGALGVLRSNLALLEGAKRDKSWAICIFEDDIELDDDFNEKFSKYVEQLPDNWQFFYLGCSNKKPSIVEDININRLTKAYGAYAVIIRSGLYDKIIEELKKEDLQIDLVYAKLQSQYCSYVVNPFLAWVRNDYSDINDRFIDVSRLRYDNAK